MTRRFMPPPPWAAGLLRTGHRQFRRGSRHRALGPRHATEVHRGHRRGDAVVIDARVGRDDQRHVGAGQGLLEIGVAKPERLELRHVGVVVGHLGAERLQAVDDLQRGALADVADAGLVGDAEDGDLGALDGLALLVERALGLLDAEVGLGLVDLAGELDELGREVQLAGLPGQVERIDGEAVAAHARARIEAHEAERLGRRGVDDLVDVDVHPVGQARQLVDERDVDRAEDVLQQLGHLGDLGGRDRDDLLADEAVDGLGAVAAGSGVRPPRIFGVLCSA